MKHPVNKGGRQKESYTSIRKIVDMNVFFYISARLGEGGGHGQGGVHPVRKKYTFFLHTNLKSCRMFSNAKIFNAGLSIAVFY